MFLPDFRMTGQHRKQFTYTQPTPENSFKSAPFANRFFASIHHVAGIANRYSAAFPERRNVWPGRDEGQARKLGRNGQINV